MSDLENKLWERARKYISILRIVPFVRMVAVCNNLAFGKIDEKSDIDIFVVAKSGRLFFVRTFITGLLHVLGVRRHGKKVAGRFCLSFFIDDSALDLSRIAIENDVYLAYWIKSMKPLIDSVSDEFLVENHWGRNFFEKESDFRIDKSKVFEGKLSFAKVLELIFGNFLGDFFEEILKNWQLKRAYKKATLTDAGASLIIDQNMLKFHNIDRRKEYRDKWISKFGKAKLTDEKFLSL